MGLGYVRFFLMALSLIMITSGPASIARQAKICREVIESEEAVLDETAARALALFVKSNLRFPRKEEIAELLDSEAADEIEPLILFSMQRHQKDFQVARNRIVQAYIKVGKALGKTPSEEQIAQSLNMEVQDFRSGVAPGRLFNDLSEIKALAHEKNPNAFKLIIDTEIFNEERTEALLEAIKRRKRLVVTTAVAGAPVNKGFFAALLNYCRINDAEILVFPANMQTEGLDPLLISTPGVHIITNSIDLSPRLRLNRIKIMAKQIRPLMGLDRLGSRGQSQIVGSPKMHVKTLPTLDNHLYPHKKYTTGAITDPHYNGALYIQGRTDEIAFHDHVIGALILERSTASTSLLKKRSVGAFHARHVEFLPDQNGFTDLNYFYDAKKSKKVRPAAIVLGDIHVGDTDQTILKALKQQVLDTQPEYIVLHDLLNGHSISHHDRLKTMTIAEKMGKGMLDLEAELSQATTFLNALLSACPRSKIVIVPSNHNDWLYRWLEDGQFMREPHNTKIGLELADVKTKGQDPLKYALFKGIEYPKRVIFLDKEEGSRFRVGDELRLVELGQHGHMGANGGKGSLLTMQRAADRLVFGHTHTDARLNGVVNVGTLTTLILPYNREGFSSWVQSLALVSSHGEIQVLSLQDREWRADQDQIDELEDDTFFVEGYPRIIPNTATDNGIGQVDQYNMR